MCFVITDPFPLTPFSIAASALVIGGNLNGASAHEITATTLVYDVTNQQFTDGPSLNVPRYRMSCGHVVANGVMYIAAVGGSATQYSSQCNKKSTVHLFFVFSAYGGLRTGSKLPVLTAYFPVLAYGILEKGGLFVAPPQEQALLG